MPWARVVVVEMGEAIRFRFCFTGRLPCCVRFRWEVRNWAGALGPEKGYVTDLLDREP